MTARRLPLTRGDCGDGPRPCRHACRHRLEGAESCALDVADRGGITREDAAKALGATRIVVARIEAMALRKLRARLGVPVPALEEYIPTKVMDRGRPSTIRGQARDARVLQALLEAGAGGTAHVAAAAGMPHKMTHIALRRLVDEGRATRKRTRGRDGFYVYSPVHSEAAE